MFRDERFITQVKNHAEISITRVEITKNIGHDIVYKLLKFRLILPVATVSVERIPPSMNYVKNKLRNRMEDQHLSYCIINDKMLPSHKGTQSYP